MKHFSDKDFFLLNRFFREEKTCYGVVLIHKNGSYQKFLGEYYQEDVVNLFNALEK